MDSRPQLDPNSGFSYGIGISSRSPAGAYYLNRNRVDSPSLISSQLFWLTLKLIVLLLPNKNEYILRLCEHITTTQKRTRTSRSYLDVFQKDNLWNLHAFDPYDSFFSTRWPIVLKHMINFRTQGFHSLQANDSSSSTNWFILSKR